MYAFVQTRTGRIEREKFFLDKEEERNKFKTSCTHPTRPNVSI